MSDHYDPAYIDAEFESLVEEMPVDEKTQAELCTEYGHIAFLFVCCERCGKIQRVRPK